MIRRLKQFIAGGLACLIMLTSSGCATTNEKHLTPEMVQSGSDNATNFKSPNGKAVTGGDLVESGATVNKGQMTVHNYYPAPQWYESGWFWLGVVAVVGLGVAAVLAAEGGATTATTTVLIAK